VREREFGDFAKIRTKRRNPAKKNNKRKQQKRTMLPLGGLEQRSCLVKEKIRNEFFQAGVL